MQSTSIITPPAAAETSGVNAPERIRQLLERDIESGALPPGSALDEKQIAARFAVSRTPVREALLMLAMQKLVAIVPRSGMYVYRPPADELIALLEFLGEAEGTAARLAATRMTTAQRTELVRIHQQSKAYARAEEKDAYKAANLALHTAIHQGSGNIVVQEEIAAARLRLSSFRRHVFDQPGRLETSYAEHAPIVLAIQEGDGDTAARTMRDHIIGKGKAFADLVLVAP